jgi:CHAD domain-containing protein
MDSRIELFVRNQFRLFRENFIASFSENAGDSVHDFRIAAKRIRMMSGFFETISRRGGMDLKFRSSGIRQAFKVAGRYREWSINGNLLAELESLTSGRYLTLRKELRDGEIMSRKEFIKLRRKFPYARCNELEFSMLNGLGSLTYNGFSRKLAGCLEGSLATIIRLITSREAAKNLHETRKEIKKIKYALEWLGISSGMIASRTFTHHGITLVEDRIGEWHDWLVFNRWLEKISERFTHRDQRMKTRLEILRMHAGRRLKRSERISVRMIRKYIASGG